MIGVLQNVMVKIVKKDIYLNILRTYTMIYPFYDKECNWKVSKTCVICIIKESILGKEQVCNKH